MPESFSATRDADEALPRSLVVFVLLLTPAPLVFNALGFSIPLGPSAGLVHSLLEWSCVNIALFTFVLGILAWIARPDPLVFIVTLAALVAGISDSVHTMTTSGLITSPGTFQDFVAWSGAVGRLLRALVLTAGGGYLLWFHRENRSFSWQGLSGLAAIAAAIALCLQWSSLLGNNPRSVLPENPLSKPWDLPLLGLILLSGIIFYPVVRRRPSLLAKALLLGTVAEAAVGLHIGFGSSALYDVNFFSAHALKVLSSLVVLSAVCLHLIRSYRREVATAESMQKLVSSLEAAKDELRSKEVRLNQLTQSIKEVFWIVDADSTRMHYVSPAYEEIFGLTAESLYREPLSFLQAVHPGDRQRMVDLVSKAEKNDFELDYRIVRPDGEVRWLRTRGFPIRNEAGEVYRLAGVTEDVTDRKRAEDELRKSEARTLALLRAMPDLMFRMSRSGVFVDYYAPPTSVSLYRPPSVFLGAQVQKVLGAALGERFERSIEEALSTGVVQTLEYRLPADGCSGDFEARFAPSSDGEVLVVVRDVTEQKRLQREILEISNREQERLGHDLHDGIAQQLMGIALLCKVLQQQLERGSIPEAEQASQIEKLVEDALAQTRSLARGLAPVEIDAGGLETALEDLARRVERMHGVRCRFRCERGLATASRTEALHLYRIAQEAVSNALRHAKPTRITIDISSANGRRRLTVVDDGTGFGPDPGSIRSPRGMGGMGLHIMRYRARMIDAIFDIRPAPDKGTIVSCEWSSAGEPVEREFQES
jgi:PAS domain S-box-containing protein